MCYTTVKTFHLVGSEFALGTKFLGSENGHNPEVPPSRPRSSTVPSASTLDCCSICLIRRVKAEPDIKLPQGTVPIYRNVLVRSCNDTANNAAHPMSTVILTTPLILCTGKHIRTQYTAGSKRVESVCLTQENLQTPKTTFSRFIEQMCGLCCFVNHNIFVKISETPNTHIYPY